jgi:hypothetical protein
MPLLGRSRAELRVLERVLFYRLTQANASPKSASGQRVPDGQQRQPAPALLHMVSPG